jgi:hypothetical protein
MFFLLSAIGGIGFIGALLYRSSRWSDLCLISGFGLYLGLCFGGASVLGLRFAGYGNQFLSLLGLFSIVGSVSFLLRVLHQKRQGKKESRSFFPQTALGPDPWVISMALLSVVIVLAFLATRPLGMMDAYAYWNVKGRFLASPEWKQMFDSNVMANLKQTHPLLLPSMTAGASMLSGHGEWATRLVHLTLFISLALVVISGFGFRQKKSHRLFAAMLFSAPYFLLHSASQYAGLGLTIAIFYALLLIHHQPKSLSGAFLSGLFMGGALWFKNEAALYLVALALLWVLRLAWPSWIGFHRKGSLSTLVVFGMSLIIPVVLLVLSKKSIPDAVGQDGWVFGLQDTSILIPRSFNDDR